MIIISGTQRSGTSLWMQIMVAGGFAYIGRRFPEGWGKALEAANPRGFYESELMMGIYHRTNPHPVTGAYLFPEQTRSHAVKVFIPGLLRTDVAFIDRCIATVRDWRSYVISMTRLHQLLPEVGSRPRLPSALQWWFDNFGLVRDVATRRYPTHVLSYASLVADPAKVVNEVFRWLGTGDADAAAQAVDSALSKSPSSTTSVPTESVAGLEPQHLELFDTFYERIHRGRTLDSALVQKLNQLHEQLRPLWLAHQTALHEQVLLDPGRFVRDDPRG